MSDSDTIWVHSHVAASDGHQDGVIAHLFAAMRGARDAGKFNSAKRSTRAERRREGKNG